MPVRLESQSRYRLLRGPTFYLECDLWRIICSVQLGPVNLLWKTLNACVSRLFSGMASLRQRICTTDGMETLESTHTHTQQHDDLLPGLSTGSSHNSSGEESHLEIRENVHHGGQGQAKSKAKQSKRNLHIFDFATMGNHSLIRNHVWFYDFSLYRLMFFIFLHKGPVKLFVKTPTVYVS